MDYDEIKADVLIAGGAITGIEAAIQAKMSEPELEVVLFEKAKAAAALARRNRKSNTAPKDVKDSLARQVAPLQAKKGMIHSMDAIAIVQEALIPYKRLYITSEDSLKEALSQIETLSRDLDYIHAPDIHEMVKPHEAKNMTVLAEMVLPASLERKESRGIHHREDYPDRDDAHWKKWLYLKKANDEMQLWAEP